MPDISDHVRALEAAGWVAEPTAEMRDGRWVLALFDHNDDNFTPVAVRFRGGCDYSWDAIDNSYPKGRLAYFAPIPDWHATTAPPDTPPAEEPIPEPQVGQVWRCQLLPFPVSVISTGAQSVRLNCLGSSVAQSRSEFLAWARMTGARPVRQSGEDR